MKGQYITSLPVKNEGVDLLYQYVSYPYNWTAYIVMKWHQEDTLRGTSEFRSAYHILNMGGFWTEICWKNLTNTDSKLSTVTVNITAFQAINFWIGPNKGTWLTFLPSILNGTDLGAQEWWDALFLRWGLEPPKLS